MALERFLLSFLCCAGIWLVGTLQAVAQPGSEQNRSVMGNLLNSSKPYTAEEETALANYLETKTQAYLTSLERLGTPDFEQRFPEIDESGAELLDVKINNLKLSLKEMVETLRLIDRLVKERPADYIRAAPLLWLNVIKDISTEQQDARDFEQMGLITSDWPTMAQTVLPRLFSKILEPKLTRLLRDETAP